MRRLALAAMLAAVATPLCAEPASVEILRPTDKDLTCEQLAAEYNQLNAEAEKTKAAEQAKAQKSQNTSMVLGLASGLAGGLMGRGGGLGVFGASSLSQAASAAQIAGARQREAQIMGSVMGGTLGPQAGGTPQQQRAERVMELFRAKSC